MMGKRYRKRTAGIGTSGSHSVLNAIRGLMNWQPFLDVDVPRAVRADVPEFTPTFDILETPAHLVIQVDLPGVRREALEINCVPGRITISGVREADAWGDGADYYALERTFGGFSRTLALPEGIAVEQIHAQLQDGVLTVLVPKPRTTEPRCVPVRPPLSA